jgi:hypothetical protein
LAIVVGIEPFSSFVRHLHRRLPKDKTFIWLQRIRATAAQVTTQRLEVTFWVVASQ